MKWTLIYQTRLVTSLAINKKKKKKTTFKILEHVMAQKKQSTFNRP